MKYQLPQFIETEVKLVGPFTLKQFLWLAAGGAILFVLYFFLHGIVFIISAIPVIALSLSLAFLKVEGGPLINYFANMLSFYLTPKKYLFTNDKQSTDWVRMNQPPQ